jgi:outer membrane receptor for ferrienterochelin and colicin
MVVGQQITPHVALDPVDAQTSMYTTMSDVFYSTYLNAGLPGSVAAQYAVLLGQIAGQFAAATAASIPSFGLVQADQSNGISRLYWGSVNFGDINYWGSDIATSYEISNAASLFANYSFVNQTEFDKEDVSGGDETSPAVYHLNIPKHRVKAGFAYNPEKGMNFGVSFRYQNSMNINTLNSSNSDLFWFDGFVPKRTVWDMNVGLPLSSKTRLDLTIDNVLGKKYQTMVNMPMVGQQALFTLTHNF